MFIKPIGHLPKAVPTKEQLELWKKPNLYGIWINEKRVPNSLLNKYKETDFSQFTVSKLSKNAVNYGKHYVQVNLMTTEYYQRYVEKNIAAKDKNHMVFLSSANHK